MRATVMRPDQVDELDRILELGHGNRNLGDFALGGTRIESLRNPMHLCGLREVVRNDDFRSVTRCEPAKRLEVFTVRFELEVHIRKARMTNLLESRRTLRRMRDRCAPLARRAKRRNGPSPDAVRQSADCRRSQVPDTVQSQLNEICA